MNAGEVVIWCFGIVCATILLGLVIIGWTYKKTDG